jgi:hypothetical protein
VKILSNQNDIRALLEFRASEANYVGTDQIRLTPPEFVNVLRVDEAAFGWQQNVFTGHYQPFWRSPIGQRFRIIVGLDNPGAGRFTSMVAVAELLGGH